MIVVIIAGGSGTRLWPLSTHERPKQILSLVGSKSLLQTTYQRARQLTKNIYVIVEASHADAVRDQLSDVEDEKIIVEPSRRGTANCVLLALNYLKDRESANEPIAFMHTDHHIRDVRGFAQSFVSAETLAARHNQIVLIGVEPSYASTNFGYIERGEAVDHGFRVASFKEKPDYETAKRYLSSGNYSWNGGYFVGSLSVFEKSIDSFAPELAENLRKIAGIKDVQSEEFATLYDTLNPDSIDYGLIERMNNLLMITANFDWVDIGSYRELHDVSDQDDRGNVVEGDVHLEDAENTFVRNDEDKPVAVIGLDNVVVVNNKDGIVVVRKDISHKVGDVAKKIQGGSN